MEQRKLYGHQVDNGSYDHCSEVRFEVRRVDGGSCGNEGVNGWNNNSTFNGNNFPNGRYPEQSGSTQWIVDIPQQMATMTLMVASL